jgi:Protein of unknown function (DUF3999)
MSARILISLMLLFFVQADQRYFRYQREITITPVQEQKQTCATLDVNTFAHAAPGLADLRVYRGTQETPYALRVAAPVSTEQASIQPLNLGSRDGSVVFDAEMPQGSYSSLQLDLQEQNFIATIEVSGGQTQAANGATRLGTYTVFDLTNQKLGRSTVLHLPVSDFRYLHFKIKGPIKPEDVTGLSIEQEPVHPAEYLTLAQTSEVAQQGRSSVAEFTVPANVPVERIEFVPASSPANFSRNVSIEVTTEQNKASAPSTYSGEIRRIHHTYNEAAHTRLRIDDEQLAIEIGNTAKSTTSKWTIKIDNGDDLPLPLTAVKLQMQKRALCFDATPGAEYMLYYGDSELTAPLYDYASLFQSDDDAAQATLGPEQNNPRFEPRPDTRPFTEKHPALLWIALVVVVIVLGGVALRSARQVPRN